MSGVAARVVDIVLDAKHPLFKNFRDIGSIRYRILGHGGRERSPASLGQAFPLSRNNFTYPLKNEIVLLFVAPVPLSRIGGSSYTYRTYYTTPVAIWNSPHFNVHPESGNPNYDGGPKFRELSNVAPLQPNLGDVLLEGRYGQSLRFTGVLSDNNPLSGPANDSQPLTILRNGQRLDSSSGFEPIVEDINKDVSSIYLTSNHRLDFSLANESRGSYLGSPPEDTKRYARPQIAVNSDRIVLNARWNDLIMSASGTVAVSSNSTHIESNNRIVLESDRIFLGGGAHRLKDAPVEKRGVAPALQQPAVLGSKNEEIFVALTGLLTTLVDAMASPDPPEIYVPKLVATANMVKKRLEHTISKIPDTKSKKVFVE